MRLAVLHVAGRGSVESWCPFADGWKDVHCWPGFLRSLCRASFPCSIVWVCCRAWPVRQSGSGLLRSAFPAFPACGQHCWYAMHQCVCVCVFCLCMRVSLHAPLAGSSWHVGTSTLNEACPARWLDHGHIGPAAHVVPHSCQSATDVGFSEPTALQQLIIFACL